jgi:hypothetical protein
MLGFYMLERGPISFRYVYPWFQQDWRLFTPPPQSNYYVYAVVDNKSGPLDIFSEICNKHQSNRLAGYGALCNALTNYLHFLENDIVSYGKETDNPNFIMVKNMIQKYLWHNGAKQKEDLRVILIIENIRNGKKRVYTG